MILPPARQSGVRSNWPVLSMCQRVPLLSVGSTAVAALLPKVMLSSEVSLPLAKRWRYSPPRKVPAAVVNIGVMVASLSWSMTQ